MKQKVFMNHSVEHLPGRRGRTGGKDMHMKHVHIQESSHSSHAYLRIEANHVFIGTVFINTETNVHSKPILNEKNGFFW